MLRSVCLFFLVILLCTCTHDKPFSIGNYQTENVIIIVIDGPRYSETWGDPLRANIPVRDSLLAYGVLVTNFRNQGTTYTNPGHTAICTGNYENIANDGSQLPTNPSIFQHWLKYYHESTNNCCLLASKDKLHVLSNCVNPMYHDLYRPYFNCGVNGDGTGGYRTDSITFHLAIDALTNKQPKLAVIAFRGPDYYAHQSDSVAYIKAIKETDRYVGEVWKFIQNDPRYKNKTTLIVTNDHGRHLDGVLNGYVSHGDGCEGCRHIEFFALSPDFKQNTELNVQYEQIDISATISLMMHFPFATGHGTVMQQLFK